MKTEPAMTVIGLRARLGGSGLDAAEIVTDGHELKEIGKTVLRSFSAAERHRPALGARAAAGATEDAAAAMLDDFAPPDLVGFQGLITDFDAAQGRVAEAGDGALLARAAGVPVAWDFISADLELGGIGLTVPACFSHALARWAGRDAPFLHLELGTRAMLALADPACQSPEEPGAVLATETGPGMGLMDAVFEQEGFDQAGRLAARGQVAGAIPEAVLEHGFFARMPPKLSPAGLTEKALLAVAELGREDALATLAAIIAGGVAASVDGLKTRPGEIWLSGGGAAHEPVVRMIAAATGLAVRSVGELGVEPGAVKAMAVAYLAARASRGLPTSGPSTTGVSAAISGAKLSHPDG